MPDVVITEFMDGDAVELLRSKYEVRYDPDLWRDEAGLSSAVVGARALVVRNKTVVDAALLASATDLEIVGRLGVGLDNIDVEACAAAGVAVKPALGANATAVAEYVIGAALLLTRGVFAATDQVVSGTWPREALVGRELAGKTMGLVGLGGIARQVAKRARALAMEVIAHDPLLPDDDPAWQLAERCPDPATVFSRADVVSLHVPLAADTAGMVDAAAVASMKPQAILINTSRGGVVDEAAVATALRAGELGGAALDVFDEEPLLGAAAAAFDSVPNLILTPHIAGITLESNAAVSRLTADNVIATLR